MGKQEMAAKRKGNGSGEEAEDKGNIKRQQC